MATWHFLSFSMCAAIVLCTLLATPLACWGCSLLGDNSLIPGKVLPSAWQKRKEMELRKANLQERCSIGRKKAPRETFFFSWSRVRDTLLLVYSVTLKRVWLIPCTWKAVITLPLFSLLEFELLQFGGLLRFLLKGNFINYLCLYKIWI